MYKIGTIIYVVACMPTLICVAANRKNVLGIILSAVFYSSDSSIPTQNAF